MALKSNVLGSANVLEAARVNNVKRVVFASSKSVYGLIEEQKGEFPIITEDHPKFDREFPGYIPYYSCTNKMVEYFGIRFAMDYGLEFVITRFGSTWGPGKIESRARTGIRKGVDKGREAKDIVNVGGDYVTLMLDHAIEGKPLKLPDGRDQKDNLVYYKDIANGMVLTALSDKIRFTGNHREFQFDAGKAITLGEVLEAIKRHIPDAKIELGPGGLTKRKHPVVQCVFDLSRGREELGYVPQYDLDAAVADYIKIKREFG
jgi:nucleoside-diphosphate-sugar epimerase